MYIEKAVKIIIYIDYKNLLIFIITKTLNRRQVRWFELLKRYKFTIKWVADKDNGWINVLNKCVNYINWKPRE